MGHGSQGKHHLDAEYRETIAETGEPMVDTAAEPIDLDYAFGRALNFNWAWRPQQEMTI